METYLCHVRVWMSVCVCVYLCTILWHIVFEFIFYLFVFFFILFCLKKKKGYKIILSTIVRKHTHTNKYSKCFTMCFKLKGHLHKKGTHFYTNK